MHSRLLSNLGLVMLTMTWARAETPAEFLSMFQAEAGRAVPGFTASVERGEQFFRRTGNQDWSCSTCHTTSPASVGRHASTGKAIEPLAPSANDRRFTRSGKVDKWFKRNCTDVIGRACSAAEKSDVLAYLISVKK